MACTQERRLFAELGQQTEGAVSPIRFVNIRETGGWSRDARQATPKIAALLAAALLGMSGLTRNVVIAQSAMPTAVMTTILAAEFECDNSFVTVAVLSTTIASVVTLTLLLNWLM